MKDGALPDLKVWKRNLSDIVGEAFLIRGVEVTVDGALVEERGHLALRVSGSRAVLRLVPLVRKVQWDPERHCERPATAAERTADERLEERARKAPGQSPRIRIIGPLEEGPQGGPPSLAVRDFTWD